MSITSDEIKRHRRNYGIILVVITIIATFLPTACVFYMEKPSMQTRTMYDRQNHIIAIGKFDNIIVKHGDYIVATITKNNTLVQCDDDIGYKNVTLDVIITIGGILQPTYTYFLTGYKDTTVLAGNIKISFLFKDIPYIQHYLGYSDDIINIEPLKNFTVRGWRNDH